MRRPIAILIICLSISIPALAQTVTRETLAQGQLDILLQAQQTLASAEQAGAAMYATTLLEDARWRFSAAQENWNASERERREGARMRANESLATARAAIAKSRWLSTNAAIRGLQEDIGRFGGRSNLQLIEERPDLVFNRGNDSRERIKYAERIVNEADAIGAWEVPGNDLKLAEQHLATARTITSNDRNNTSADYLAFMAEMMARRAFYTARLQQAERNLGPAQLERTRLAQLANEREVAAAERARREANQQAAADMQRLIDQAAADRAARLEAEQRLDTAMSQYENAIANASVADIESLRRQVEDQQLALRSLQQREVMTTEQLATDVQRLRSELEAARASLSADVVATREAELRRREEELTRIRTEREETVARRTEMERQRQQEIETARVRRVELEAQAEQMRQQVAEAQEAARRAQESVAQVQANAEQIKAAAQQTEARVVQTQEEVEKLRSQLSASESETRRLRMQQELSTIASTRTDERGLIVTLPGIFFDVGKSQLKPGARTTLTRIAERLRAADNVTVAIEGHTDSTGSDDANQRLSEARALAVKNFLVGAGLTADRLTAAGRGEVQPVATNNNTAGRQQNRRVELVINE